MNTYANKTQESDSRPVTNSASRGRGDAGYGLQFTDNLPGAIAQRKLHEMANSGRQTTRLLAFRKMADAYAGSRHQAVQEATRTNSDNSGAVAQRTPQEWRDAPQITRMLEHPHGWFSTWKQIKAKIREYTALLPANLDARESALDELGLLIGEWEADPKHTAQSTEQRVHDISADLPILRDLMQREYAQIEDARVANYYATGVIDNPAVPAQLTAGIAALANIAQKAARLFQNINNFRFRYTGGFLDPRMAFTAHQGDCRTLVGMYERAANAEHIPFLVGNLDGRQLVAPRPIHGRNTTANTEGNTAWYFREHFWAIGAGVQYDVLFMTSPSPAAVMMNGHAVHNGVTYYTFGDGRCVIEPGEAALNYQIKGEGRVFASEEQAKQFIEDHPI